MSANCLFRLSAARCSAARRFCRTSRTRESYGHAPGPKLGVSHRSRYRIRSTDLTTKILDFDRPALKCHHEARLELVLSAAKLRIGDVGVKQQAQLVHKVGEDVRGSGAHEIQTHLRMGASPGVAPRR